MGVGLRVGAAVGAIVGPWVGRGVSGLATLVRIRDGAGRDGVGEGSSNEVPFGSLPPHANATNISNATRAAPPICLTPKISPPWPIKTDLNQISRYVDLR